jgi:hypothetical protein
VSSIEEVVTHLRAAVNFVRGAIVAVQAAMSQVGEIRDRSEAFGVGEVVRRMEALRELVKELERFLVTSMATVEELIARTETIGDDGGTQISAAMTRPVAAAPEQVAERLPVTPG